MSNNLAPGTTNKMVDEEFGGNEPMGRILWVEMYCGGAWELWAEVDGTLEDAQKEAKILKDHHFDSRIRDTEGKEWKS